MAKQLVAYLKDNDLLPNRQSAYTGLIIQLRPLYSKNSVGHSACTGLWEFSSFDTSRPVSGVWQCRSCYSYSTWEYRSVSEVLSLSALSTCVCWWHIRILSSAWNRCSSATSVRLYWRRFAVDQLNPTKTEILWSQSGVRLFGVSSRLQLVQCVSATQQCLPSATVRDLGVYLDGWRRHVDDRTRYSNSQIMFRCSQTDSQRTSLKINQKSKLDSLW